MKSLKSSSEYGLAAGEDGDGSAGGTSRAVCTVACCEDWLAARQVPALALLRPIYSIVPVAVLRRGRIRSSKTIDRECRADRHNQKSRDKRRLSRSASAFVVTYCPLLTTQRMFLRNSNVNTMQIRQSWGLAKALPNLRELSRAKIRARQAARCAAKSSSRALRNVIGPSAVNKAGHRHARLLRAPRNLCWLPG